MTFMLVVLTSFLMLFNVIDITYIGHQVGLKKQYTSKVGINNAASLDNLSVTEPTGNWPLSGA